MSKEWTKSQFFKRNFFYRLQRQPASSNSSVVVVVKHKKMISKKLKNHTHTLQFRSWNGIRLPKKNWRIWKCRSLLVTMASHRSSSMCDGWPSSEVAVQWIAALRKARLKWQWPLRGVSMGEESVHWAAGKAIDWHPRWAQWKGRHLPSGAVRQIKIKVHIQCH